MEKPKKLTGEQGEYIKYLEIKLKALSVKTTKVQTYLTIKKIIDSQTSPAKEDIDMGQEPCNVYDLYTGKNFNIKVTIKGGYWNYDECKFADSKSALMLNDAAIERTPESQKEVIAYLNDAPKITMYEYRAMDAEKQEKLFAVLADIDTSNPGQSYNAMATDTKASTQTSVQTETVEDPLDNALDNALDTVNDAAAPKDDLDDFLKKLK